MNISLFIHPTVDGYLGCFQFGAIMNSASINILGHMYAFLLYLGMKLLYVYPMIQQFNLYKILYT